MTITIRLRTDNAAFHNDNDPEARDREVARILREWSARIPEDGYSANLYDCNGNRVGTVSMTGRNR